MTELDAAHEAMQAAPEDDVLRLRFYERLSDGEVFLLLDHEPDGDDVTPTLIKADEASYVVVFDREDRLSAYVGAVAPYAGLSGRALVQMLAGQGIGLALNPDVAPSATLVPAEVVDWLATTLARAPTMGSARPVEIFPPQGVPEALLLSLDRKLAGCGGMAQMSWLVSVSYDDGGKGHLFAFVGASRGAETALAAAVSEALTFSGIEAGALDVTFLDASDPIIPRLARVGLRYDLPALVVPTMPGTAPGMDPTRPPRLI